ncbi:Uncharacterized protein QTN25_001901 [Entamoeba marina]
MQSLQTVDVLDSFAPSYQFNSSILHTSSVDYSAAPQQVVSPMDCLESAWNDADPWIDQLTQYHATQSNKTTMNNLTQTTSTENDTKITPSRVNHFNSSIITAQIIENYIQHINTNNEIIFESKLREWYDSLRSTTNDIELIKFRCQEVLSSLYLEGNVQINKNKFVQFLHSIAFTNNMDVVYLTTDPLDETTSKQDNDHSKDLLLNDSICRDNTVLKESNNALEMNDFLLQFDDDDSLMHNTNDNVPNNTTYPFVEENEFIYVENAAELALQERISGSNENALLLLEAALQNNHDQKELWTELGILLQEEERDDNALIAFEEANNCHASEAEENKEIEEKLYYSYLSTLYNLEETKKMVDVIKTKHELQYPQLEFTESVQHIYNYLSCDVSSTKLIEIEKALLSLVLGNGEAAAKHFDQCFHVKSWLEWNRIGVCYSFACMNEKAIECYQQSLQLKGNNARVHKNMGISYQNLGKWKDAVYCYATSLLYAEGVDTWDALQVALLICGYDDFANRCEEDNRDSYVVNDILESIDNSRNK